MIFAAKCKVDRTGIASLGWQFGHGFVRGKIKVSSDQWCVIDGSKVIAECRSKNIAENIAYALNKNCTYSESAA